MKLLRVPFSYYQTHKSFSLSRMRKAPGAGGKDEKSINQDFVDFLFELSNYEKNVNRNTFKGNAYKKVNMYNTLNHISFWLWSYYVKVI